jgi:ABC-type nitrate/sulfonate/bicarbonate transport system ATPase subunit
VASIRLEGVCKSYGGNTVLSDLSLDVRHGECFTLLGPSGCGKTVLLRLIAGFEKPEAGSIRIGDRRVSDAASSVNVPPNERGLGVVFQDYAVWPHMSVFDNIAYPLKLAGVDGHALRARVMESVEQVNLGGLESRLPSQLSGGQQQRVALARALVAKPALLLLDEPLCNLDANLREEMRFEIKELQRNLGITILYVTHDQEIALAISDRLAIMDETGAIRQIGPPADVFERPDLLAASPGRRLVPGAILLVVRQKPPFAEVNAGGPVSAWVLADRLVAGERDVATAKLCEKARWLKRAGKESDAKEVLALGRATFPGAPLLEVLATELGEAPPTPAEGARDVSPAAPPAPPPGPPAGPPPG